MTDELKAYEDLIRYKADKYDELKEAIKKIKKEISEIHFSHDMSEAYKTVYEECLKSPYEIKNEALDIIKKHTEGLL